MIETVTSRFTFPDDGDPEASLLEQRLAALVTSNILFEFVIPELSI